MLKNACYNKLWQLINILIIHLINIDSFLNLREKIIILMLTLNMVKENRKDEDEYED